MGCCLYDDTTLNLAQTIYIIPQTLLAVSRPRRMPCPHSVLAVLGQNSYSLEMESSPSRSFLYSWAACSVSARLAAIDQRQRTLLMTVHVRAYHQRFRQETLETLVDDTSVPSRLYVKTSDIH